MNTSQDMRWSKFRFLLLCVLWMAEVVNSAKPDSAQSKRTQLPHIFMVLVDDWGSYDASWRMRDLDRTPDIHTPAIDELSANGIRFANYYVQPICTPTRSVLMTGRYSIHTGCEHILFGASEPSCLPTTLPIMPSAFKSLGYQTHMAGKWHLGYVNNSCSPWTRGFDTYLGYLNGVGGYFKHGMGPYMDFHECASSTGTMPSSCDKCTHRYEGLYSTHVYTDHVLGLIEKWHTDDSPLFVYLAYQAVHEPLDVPASYLEDYTSIEDPSRRTYAGMLSCLDEGIGNISKALEHGTLGMANNYVIVVSNDNGGMSGSYGLGCCQCGTSCGGLNYPYRGWKDSFWEGGFRGNGFLHSPLLTSTGFTYEPLLHVSDWFATLVGAALAQMTVADRSEAKQKLSKLFADGPIDSVNQWPALADGGSWKNADTSPRSEILLAGIDSDKKGAAIRVGDLKLLVGNWGADTWCDLNVTGLSPIAPAPPAPPQPEGPVGGRGGLVCVHINHTFSSFHKSPSPWYLQVKGLYNVTADPREMNDLQNTMPAAVRSLMDRLLFWNQTRALSIHRSEDPAGTAHANATNCWSPWANLSSVQPVPATMTASIVV